MKKYFDYDTGGKYIVYSRAVGYFADVQTVAQAEDAARLWWALTADRDAVIIRERDGKIVKIMRQSAEEEEQ